MTPRRIQLKRTRGWRKPAGAVVVSRPSKWGNPVCWESNKTFDPATGETDPADPEAARRISVQGFRSILDDVELRRLYAYPSDAEIVDELAGKDLCCWCPLVDGDGNPAPCHADVLLAIANGWDQP